MIQWETSTYQLIIKSMQCPVSDQAARQHEQQEDILTLGRNAQKSTQRSLFFQTAAYICTVLSLFFLHKCYWSAACLFTQVPLSPITFYLAPVCRSNTSSNCSLVQPLTTSMLPSMLRPPQCYVHSIENLVIFFFFFCVCMIIYYEEFCSLPNRLELYWLVLMLEMKIAI